MVLRTHLTLQLPLPRLYFGYDGITSRLAIISVNNTSKSEASIFLGLWQVRNDDYLTKILVVKASLLS